MGNLTSAVLREGQVYTREELKRRFDITDATVNNGVFQPIGHDSILVVCHAGQDDG